MGGRRPGLRGDHQLSTFQSTPPRGGRRLPVAPQAAGGGVSIHAPAWGATSLTLQGHLVARVSIHAPAWGATHIYEHPDAVTSVSIHAPAWGATGIELTQEQIKFGFNPRPRVGGDRQFFWNGLCCIGVSIHAPAWGANGYSDLRERAGREFQSTPPRGGRPANSSSVRGRIPFQSTPPRGGRRRFRRYDDGRYIVSIHRPRVGGRLPSVASRVTSSVFQSTPPRGGRPLNLHPQGGATMFQSTPPRGGRRQLPFLPTTLPTVSIHAPAWGAT